MAIRLIFANPVTNTFIKPQTRLLMIVHMHGPLEVPSFVSEKSSVGYCIAGLLPFTTICHVIKY